MGLRSYNHRGFVTFSAGIALCAKRSEVTVCARYCTKSSFHLNVHLQGNARACTLRTRPSHRVPEPTLINCKFCHAGRCYKHILSTYNVHSSEALLVSLADNTGKTWHALHQSKRDAYGENYAWIKTMVRMGSPASLTDRLVYFASNFSSTTPINQAVSPGFYDTPEAVSLFVVFWDTSQLLMCPPGQDLRIAGHDCLLNLGDFQGETSPAMR